MKLPLLETLLQYHNEHNLILSMPGNKCGRGFERDNIGKEFLRRMGKLDITEVEPLDNLHCPEGIIEESQHRLAEVYNAKKAFFLVNGSSCGNMSAVFSAFNEGDEVMIERNCHKSVYNAAVLRKLKVVYIEPEFDKNFNIPLPVNEKNILEALKRCSNPKGIILTSPNYFGILYDIENIIKKLREKKITSIIDAAHGAHYGFCSTLPKSLSSIADYVIMSAHKTLPALTQGAYLIVNKEDKNIQSYLSMFMTTSPSYLIMASLDYARYYLQTYAKEDYSELIVMADNYRKKINSLNKVHILSSMDFNNIYNVDRSRYIMILPEHFSGDELLQYLRSQKIQCEMSFGNCVVLILSPFNTEKDFQLIYNAVNNLNIEKLNKKSICNMNLYYKVPEKRLEPYEIEKKEYEQIHYKQCIGKTAAQSVIPYPPGIPVICPGEIIDAEIIKSIEKCLKNKQQIIGIRNEMIKILK